MLMLSLFFSLLFCILEIGSAFNSYSFHATHQATPDVAGIRLVTRLASNKVEEKPPTAVAKKPVAVNGEHQPLHKNSETDPVVDVVDSESLAAKTVEDVVELIAEIDRRVSDGSSEILRNLTQGMDEKFNGLPDDAADELTTYLSDLTNQVQKAQQRELQRQLAEIETRFVRPFEELAFSDVPLFESTKAPISLERKVEADAIVRQDLVLTGENSTLAQTRRLRTREILRNFNVAPVYYSIALCLRWARKASEPSVYLLSVFKHLATVIKSAPKKSKGQQSYEEYLRDAETMQAGWKRTGEIAAKGPLARKWAILRRSAEIWAYFSSFYLKDRRIAKNYQSGRWDEERHSSERSKLGVEIVQNLLKLGPTFIKVRTYFHRNDNLCVPVAFNHVFICCFFENFRSLQGGATVLDSN